MYNMFVSKCGQIESFAVDGREFGEIQIHDFMDKMLNITIQSGKSNINLPMILSRRWLLRNKVKYEFRSKHTAQQTVPFIS